ncbi:Tol biopolymer transport system component [Kitasatospora sp. MAP12-15]|uniref:hypothetical protein n=1 Tax=unclassified Kitasatospora TaxID=2633591 RepID=UPI002473A6D8|nr:hypothetical protein [Kitasatospora sp. MAP12-44]MDH6115588.1 Tol biopolymer transport system component [Kitasatospora sp. MAP12-44]
MPARTPRRATSAAVVLTFAVTGTALLLTGCGPADATKAMPSTASSAPTAPTDPSAPTNPTLATPTNPTLATPSTARSTHTTPPAMNGTANSKLTISNGTRDVLMNGTSVDFGTAVRDLTWSPDGSRAAFIDGDGDLATAKPDGSGRVVVAKHVAGQTWSHPAWEFTADGQFIWFASSAGGVSTLENVPADAVDGTPGTPHLVPGYQEPELPQTANTWPSSHGLNGLAVHANSQTGDIYERTDWNDGQGTVLTAGSEPMLCANENEVAFVRSVGGHDHIFLLRLEGQAPAKDLTPNATVDYTEPAISPDGATVAARTPDGIATLPADGSAAPTLISTHPGLPTYR